MAKVTYKMGDSGAEEVEAFGVAFTDGKAVEVDDDVAARLHGNPFFEVKDEAVKLPIKGGKD